MKQNYYTELDSLRGMAAMGVVLYHCMTPFIFWGWSCVDLFFVLSGFLITSIIFNNIDDSSFFKAFYIRRALRIWPVYFLLLLGICLVYLIAVLFFDEPLRKPTGISLYFVFLQYVDCYFVKGQESYFHYFHCFQQSWSLAVEEQFYLFWPMVFFFLRPSFIKMIVCTIIFCWLAVYMASQGFESVLLLVKSHGLLLGILLSYIAYERDQGKVTWYVKKSLWIFVLAIGIGLMLVFPYLIEGYSVSFDKDMHKHVPPYMSLAFSLVYFGIVGLCVLFAGNPYLKLLRLKPLLWLGSISYGLYMYHPVVFDSLVFIFNRYHVFNGYILLITGFLMSLLIAHLSYQFMEKKFLNMRKKYPYDAMK
jgi:peptidoglycan/LPS O-acetylase OafA/YrhL